MDNSFHQTYYENEVMKISRLKLMSLVGMLGSILILMSSYEATQSSPTLKVVVFIIAALLFLVSSRGLRKSEMLGDSVGKDNSVSEQDEKTDEKLNEK